MQMSRYVRLSKGLYDKGTLISPESVFDNIKEDVDYYVSPYFYNEEHYKAFKQKGSIKGIKDVLTNKIWFDFDKKEDPSLAQADTQVLVTRLRNYGIQEKDIEIYFSGNKGFNVQVTLNRELNPDQVYSLAINKFGSGLSTIDSSIYDSAQIIRVPGTRHQVTQLYKIPLTLTQLNTLTINEVKTMAKSLDNISDFEWGVINPKEEFFDLPKEQSKVIKTLDIDFNNKNPQWRNCKWSLLQGNFKSGERHSAMMVIAATAKALGFDEVTANHLCASAAEKQAAKTNTPQFPPEELEENIIPSVYTNDWEGGQYTCEKPGWLQSYCTSLGDHQCAKSSQNNTIEINEAFTLFKDYAQNIDTLTIGTGIPAIDRNLRMTIGMSVGIVAGPGTGKTSLALQVLNNMSKRNEQCVFFSYDMYHSLVFQKLVQKHFQLDPDDIFNYFKEDNKDFQAEVMEVLKDEYKNVAFCFKTGQTPDDIIKTIKETEEKTQKKVRLIVIDYNELVLSDINDSTASSSYVAQKLREIATSLNICVVVLLQPNKMAGAPSDEILSYRSAKGSSAIEQSLSVMLGMSRPGYSPKNPDEDRFITINALKNRMGRLFSVDLHWDGLTGSVRELLPEENSFLKEIRKRKEEESKGEEKWS